MVCKCRSRPEAEALRDREATSPMLPVAFLPSYWIVVVNAGSITTPASDSIRTGEAANLSGALILMSPWEAVACSVHSFVVSDVES